jgi:chemotaxis response regulator CheB
VPITALIVDDEPLARKRVRRLLHEAPDPTDIGEAASGKVSRAYRERLDGSPQ